MESLLFAAQTFLCLQIFVFNICLNCLRSEYALAEGMYAGR